MRIFHHPAGMSRAALLAVFALATVPGGIQAARAQAIALAVNGDPITNIDIEQRMKLLRVLRRPATHDAAVESMISDRLKNREATRFGVTIKDNEIGEEIGSYALKQKVSPQQLLADLEHGGVERDHFVGFFKSELGFDVLVKALNKGVEASEIAVRSEMAKGAKASFTQYTIRQVVLTLGSADGQGAIESRAKEAEALRGKFLSCATGIPYAKTLAGVAVREPVTRTSTQISSSLKDLLDKTPVGHLSAPSRSSSGLEMVAVCERGAPKDDTELRKSIADRLLQVHIDQDTLARLKDMRSRAVIEKR